MARYKAIPSQKAEFDAFWDDLMTELGATPEQIEQTKRESAQLSKILQADTMKEVTD